MAIDFVIRANKLKAPRVVVLRAVLNDRGRVIKFDTLGSLKGLDAASLKAFALEKKLDEHEQFQLENYAASLNFNQQEFKAEIDKLQPEKFLYITPEYRAGLLKLWKLARKHNIAFNPVEIQQRALLHKAKAVEREMNKKLGKPVNILEAIGVDIRRYDRDDLKLPDKTGQKLFHLIRNIKTPSAEILCHEFNKLAKERYGKNVSLKPHYLKDYANSNKRYPLWYCTVAIDLLLAQKINPIKHIAPSRIAEHWLRLRKNEFNADQACQAFASVFKPGKADEAGIKRVIKLQYEKGNSTANA